MTWQRMGVLSLGAMGATVATVLRVHGLRTVTCLEERSARSVNARSTPPAHQAASCIRVSCASPFETRCQFLVKNAYKLPRANRATTDSVG